ADQRLSRSNSRDAALVLAEQTAPGDLIVTVPDVLAVALNYYLPPGREQLDLPELARVDAIDWRGWPSRLEDRARDQDFARRLRQAARQGRRVWLAYWAPFGGGLPGHIP